MVTINNKLFNSWLPPKASAEVEAHQAKLVVAHRQLGCDTGAERLHYCGYRDPSKFTKFTFRCDNRYCRRCGHRRIRQYFDKLSPMLNDGGQFRLMTLGVAESKKQDWNLVKEACDLRSRLLNLAPFKKVVGALCSIEISWQNQAFFTHMHVFYLGNLVKSRGKAPQEKIQSWQRKNFSHDHYDDKPVGQTYQDLHDVISYLYKGYKEHLFPLDAVQSYVEATKSSLLVTPRGCFRG